MTAATCIFCRIVAGELPCHRVYEDEHTLVFMDIFPVADGHALVITKQHAATIFEADEEALTAVAATARRVAHAIRSVLAPDGLMVFQLNGAAAMQTRVPLPHAPAAAPRGRAAGAAHARAGRSGAAGGGRRAAGGGA